jgi:anti-sigma B factor antagonist
MAYVETMRENMGDIKFSNMQENVYNIFDLLGFPILYEFYKDENEAIKKFDLLG